MSVSTQEFFSFKAEDILKLAIGRTQPFCNSDYNFEDDKIDGRQLHYMYTLIRLGVGKRAANEFVMMVRSSSDLSEQNFIPQFYTLEAYGWKYSLKMPEMAYSDSLDNSLKRIQETEIIKDDFLARLQPKSNKLKILR